MEFYPCYQDVTSNNDTKANIMVMKDLYVDAVGKLPPNAPKPIGIPIHNNCLVESDHASDRVTRHYMTSILLHLNIGPIIFC